MAVFNLRGIRDDLARMVKATAASEGKTLVEFTVELYEGAVRRGGWTAAKAEGRNGQGAAVPEIKEAGQENRATRKQSRNVGGEKVGVARPQEAEAVNSIETDAVGGTGCKVTVSRPMAGRPAHAGNCGCLTCKPPKGE